MFKIGDKVKVKYYDTPANKAYPAGQNGVVTNINKNLIFVVCNYAKDGFEWACYPDELEFL